MDREELRLERVDAMEEASNRLDGPVKQYLSGELSEDELYKSILTVFTDQWNADFGLFDRLVDAWDWFREQIKPGIDKIVPDSVPRTVADWLGTVIVNGSRAAKSDDGLMWLSRRDNRVRPKHITADGQVVRVGEPFQVGGYDVPFPGAPVGPPELWLNCRCAAVPASMVASVDGYAQWDVISGRSGDAPLPSEVLLAGAGAALPPTVGPDEPLPGVAAFAGVSSGSPSGWVLPAQEVGPLIDILQVTGVYAGRGAAQMVEDAIWFGTVGEFPGNTVRKALLANGLVPDLPVTVVVRASGPQPAAFAYFNVLPEAFFEGAVAGWAVHWQPTNASGVVKRAVAVLVPPAGTPVVAAWSPWRSLGFDRGVERQALLEPLGVRVAESLAADGTVAHVYGTNSHTVEYSESGYDILFLENRRTPKVVKRGERYQPKPSEGRITKRRRATKDEEKIIRRGDWLRVNERGEKPGDPRYKDKKSRVRPQHNSVEAAADNGTGKVIVAIPADDDPVWEVSSETKPHMTMIWLGEQEFAAADWDAILAAVRAAASSANPVEIPITGREELGDDAADVLMIDPGPLAAVRDDLLRDETIRAGYEAVDQYPQWTPHVTLGYPETPAKQEPSQDTIRFDRLAVWDGEFQGEEFPMPELADEMTADDVAAFAKPDDDTIDVEGVEDEIEDVPEEEILDEDIDKDEEEFDLPDMIPWYGVLAPEGVRSGDGRKFSEGALTHRDLPLPFRWQESDVGGHDGAVAVGTIDRIWRDGNLYMGSGLLQDSEVADRFIGHVLDGSVRGISVDVDDAEMAADMDDNEVEFSKGRVCAATAVMIPAFAQAFIALGEYMGDSGSEEEFKDYDTEQRKRAADRGAALPDGSYPINDCEDLHNAIQAIGRAKDPDKVKAHIRKRKKALGCEDIELPDTWALDDELSMTASGDEEFKRGAGWVTHPKETKRLWSYWVHGKGAQKVRWNTPGDFRRLRKYLRKYISPAYLNRTVAQWHRDATGRWPGQHSTASVPPSTHGTTAEDALRQGARVHAGEHAPPMAASVHLVASSAPVIEAWYFDDPQLTDITPVTIDGDHIYGHIAPWNECHIGMSGVCTTAPHSAHQYAYFRTGAVRTDNGLIPVGNITMNTGHADLNLDARRTVSHYDHTSTIVADIACGEDEFGIWFSGALRPKVTDEQKREILAVGISGDWRNVGGNLELVAALCVPVPGFPIKRVAASLGVQTALVIPPVKEEPIIEVNGEPVPNHLVDALAAALEERQDRRDRVAWLQSEVREQRVAALKAKFG